MKRYLILIDIMQIDEKQLLLNAIDNHLNRIQNSINSMKSLQANTSFMIGTILLGTFGVILLGFLKPAEFCFKNDEINLAIMVFISSTILLCFYFLFNFFLGYNRAKKALKKMAEEKINIKKIKMKSIHSIFKPFIYMSLLSTISTLFFIPTFSQHKYLFSILSISMLFFTIELIILYFYIKKFLIKFQINHFLQTTSSFLNFLGGKSILFPLKLLLISFFQSGKKKIFTNILILIFFLSLSFVLLLPAGFCILIPFSFFIKTVNIPQTTWVLTLLVLMLQFIISYPLKKYFIFQIGIDTCEDFFERLDDIRIKIINETKTYQEIKKIYNETLTEYPYNVI